MDDLAHEIGARVETLSRQLRKYAEKKRGIVEPSNERVTRLQGDNTMELESVSSRITTLEQLVEYCQVDTSEWAVERHIVNKWEVGRKETQKDLTWNGGVADGYARDTGGIVVEPLFQVKAWMVRRHPVAIQPVIKPVNINVRFSSPVERRRGLKAALILPDPQFGFARNIRSNKLNPFHDRLALDIVRQIAQVVQPDTSVFLGDVQDMSAWSDKFIRMPEFYFTTQPTLIETAWYIGQVQGLTSGDTYVMDGNHDVRPETQIIKHLMEAYQLRSADGLDAGPVLGMDNLLGLTRMGVQYIQGYPDGEMWLNDTTRVIHGVLVRSAPGQTASAVVRNASASTIFGHIHKYEIASRTVHTRDGSRYITAYSPGCLCRVDGVVPGSSRDNNWQQGAAIVWYDAEHSHITHIHIEDGVGYYNGEAFVGRDYTADLKEQTDWDF